MESNDSYFDVVEKLKYMPIISKTQSAILATNLIVLWVLGGCTAPVMQQSESAPLPPYIPQSRTQPIQSMPVFPVVPSPYKTEIYQPPVSNIPLGGGGFAADNREQRVVDGAKTTGTVEPFAKLLYRDDVARLISGHVKDRTGWAEDVLKTFSALNFQPTQPNVCSVLAIIQQESGFQANPEVKGMHKIILNSLNRKYGKLGTVAISKMLNVKLPGERKSLWHKLMSAKTEYQVDRVFRDYIVYQEVNHPSMISMASYTGKAFGINDINQLNPITTIGSMQVSVKYSRDQSKAYGASEWKVRESLYTRYGGVYFGTRRLLGYQTNYTDPVYRFADYNLGMYASRNAALQQQLSTLIGYKLALDGDLLRYLKNGSVDTEESETEKAILVFARRFNPTLDNLTIHNDLYLEKTSDFEYTRTYLAIKQVYAFSRGAPPYAILPVVEITGPKIKSKFTTALYAKAVNAKFQKCFKESDS
jgi:hypothetical protein